MPGDASIVVEVASRASGRFRCTITAMTHRPVVEIPTPLGVGATEPDLEEIAMLEGKTRIPPVDVEALPDDLRDTLDEQRKLRGAALYPYLFYARNPEFFRAAQGMWTALQQHTKRVPGTLRTLLNRRVAWWNGCEF